MNYARAIKIELSTTREMRAMHFAERKTITICVSLIRKEICIQISMSLQLLSSSADCSSVLQLDPAELFRLYLLLNSSIGEAILTPQ